MYSSHYLSKLWRRFHIEIIIIFISFSCIAVSGYFIYSSLQATQETTVVAEKINPENKEPGKVTVEVSGQVLYPGVFTLKSGLRIHDAIESAGGLSELAAREFVARNFNLTLLLHDMQKIHVPSYIEIYDGIFLEQDRYLSYLDNGPDTNTALVQQQSPDTKENKVNLNVSSTTDLEDLPGIGPKTAEKIVENRPYSNKDDVLSKKVISDSVMKQIENLVSY